VLTQLLSELLLIMRDSGRSFVSYISDLLGRCKLQKAVLHTLLASVYDARQKTHGELVKKYYFHIHSISTRLL
jgi:hypothetical protein